MMTSRSDRLRAARVRAGYSSVPAAAEAFGWGEAGYRHHENGTRQFGLEAAEKYAQAFRVRAGHLLCLPGFDAPEVVEYAAGDILRVTGSVAAGVWREPAEDFELMEIDTPAPIAGGQRFGLIVEGHSMDLFYEPGTILDCISIFPDGVEPEGGDHVIVERIKPDGLRETTVKEFASREGRNFLIPRSTRPEFSAEIEVGTPDHNADEQDGHVRVIGFVVSAIPPRSLKLLDRLGKVRRMER